MKQFAIYNKYRILFKFQFAPILLLLFSQLGISQNCNKDNTSVSNDGSYKNVNENFSLPLNKSWKIIIENYKAINVTLEDESRQGFISVLHNKNGYNIPSAHEITESVVNQLFKSMKYFISNRTITNTYLKNIKVKQIEYDYTITNLNDTYLMTGIMFMAMKGGYTFIFMFNCSREMKNCYLPFYKNVMKNAFFGPEWYHMN